MTVDTIVLLYIAFVVTGISATLTQQWNLKHHGYSEMWIKCWAIDGVVALSSTICSVVAFVGVIAVLKVLGWA